MTEKAKSGGGGCLILLIGAAAVVSGIYFGLDSVDWIPHQEDSVITAQVNWFVGESKECYSYPLDEKAANAINKPVGDAVSQISCDGGPEHRVSITFYGKKEQPESSWATWNCTRKEDSFVCKQTGAGPAP